MRLFSCVSIPVLAAPLIGLSAVGMAAPMDVGLNSPAFFGVAEPPDMLDATTLRGLYKTILQHDGNSKTIGPGGAVGRQYKALDRHYSDKHMAVTQDTGPANRAPERRNWRSTNRTTRSGYS